MIVYQRSEWLSKQTSSLFSGMSHYPLDVYTSGRKVTWSCDILQKSNKRKEAAMLADREFLTRLRLHEEAAFTEFFETYADRVYRLAIGLLKQEDDAEEVVQATFFSAFEAIDRFEPQAQISTWLYRIAYNHALMLLRRRHATDPLPEEADSNLFPAQLVDWSQLPDQQALSSEDQQILRTAINDLPLGF